MTYVDRPVVFDCEGDRLVGILSVPERPSSVGLVVVVGGPQYRVGSHRQFRHLAGRLAEQGVPVLRFDYRGMGDSDGAARSFEKVDADVLSAVRCLTESVSGVRKVVLWGLCDGASAACLAAPLDPRVAGLVLLNPWVRTEVSQAATYLRHYYVKRLASADFWHAVLRGNIGITRAAGGLLATVRRVLAGRARSAATDDRGSVTPMALPDRMAAALERFGGAVGIILSGDDMTAREFADLCSASPRWNAVVARAGWEKRSLEGANHTFSRREWREQVADWTLEWISTWRARFS